MRRNFKKILASILSTTLVVGTMGGFVSSAADSTSETLTVNGSNIYANGNDMRLESAEDGVSTMIYMNETLVTDAVILGDADGTDGYDLSTVTIYGGSKEVITDDTVSITMNGGNVYAIYAGGEAILNMDVEAEMDELEGILNEAITDIVTELGSLDYETQLSIEAVIADLEALMAEYEKKLELAEGSTTAILEILEAYAKAIEETIAPYILETSADYVGEVGEALLKALEDAMVTYLEELSQTVTDKVEKIALASVIDVITALTGITLTDLDDVEEMVEALVVVVNYETTSADAQKKLADAKEALETWKSENSEPVATDAPEVVEEPKLLKDLSTEAVKEALAKRISEEDVAALVSANGLSGKINEETLRKLLISGTEMTIDDLKKLYTGGIGGLIGDLKKIGNLLAGASTLTSEAIAKEYDTYYASETDQDYIDAKSAYDQYIIEKGIWDSENEQYYKDLEQYKKDIAVYNQAVKDANAEVSAVASAYDSAISTLFKLGITNAGSLDISALMNNIEFLVAASGVLTKFADDIATEQDPVAMITLVESLVTELEGLAAKYGVEETIKGLIEDILANVEEEFNADFLADEVKKLESTLETTLKTFVENLGTEGYPELPSTVIEEILNTVIADLDAVVSDEEYEAIVAGIKELLDPSEIEALTSSIYKEITEYLLTADASLEGIQKIIISAVYDAILPTLVKVLGAEADFISVADIYINGGEVKEVHAIGAGAGYYVKEVNITYLKGTIIDLFADEIKFVGSEIDTAAFGLPPYLEKLVKSILKDMEYTFNEVNVTMIEDETTTPPGEDGGQPPTPPDEGDGQPPTPPDEGGDDTVTPDEDGTETTPDSGNDEVVDTGDHSNVALWIVLFVMSIAGAGVVVMERKRVK